MVLPGAPIAQEGFLVTHWFIVKDQEKSKDFDVRNLGGTVIKPANPCYMRTGQIFLDRSDLPRAVRRRDKPEVVVPTTRDLDTDRQFLNCAWPHLEVFSECAEGR